MTATALRSGNVIRISVYLSKEEVAALRKAAARSGRSSSELVRTALRTVLPRPDAAGFVAIWDGELKRTSIDHDA